MLLLENNADRQLSEFLFLILICQFINFVSLTIDSTNPQQSDFVKPLLVLAQPRAGTTLLMQLLGTSPQIAFERIYPFERRYLTYLLNWMMVLGKPWNPNGPWDPTANYNGNPEMVGPVPFERPHWLERDFFLLQYFPMVWREFSRVIAERTGANQIGAQPILFYAEKIPYWVLGPMRRVLPYQIILLVRDPRDVFLSMNAFDQKRGYPGFDRQPNDDDAKFAARLAESSRGLFNVMQVEEQNARSILVKYEQLVLDLAGESARISEWLGVELDSAAVKSQERQFAHHMTSKNPKSSVERWRRELPEAISEVFIREVGDELQHFGYRT